MKVSNPRLIATRRQFLAAGSLGAAALPLRARAAEATSCRNGKPNWIPTDEFLDRLPKVMEFYYVPGLSMAVIDKEAVVWTGVKGVTNAETRQALTPENTFEAASMGKPIFAYVVMKLVDEGLIDLDRPLVQYRRPDYLGDDPNLDLITTRDALRHSTGLPNWRTDWKERLKTQFKPGTQFGYSGEGLFWVQLAVEKVTGQGIDSVMRARLFEPLGLAESTYAWDAAQEKWAVDGSGIPDRNASGGMSGNMGDAMSGGTGGATSDVPFQVGPELAKIRMKVAAKWGKPFTAWTYDDNLRAVPEVQELIRASGRFPTKMVGAPAGAFELPMNTTPNVAGTFRTTPTEYAKVMTLMMPRAKRAPWEISEASRREMLKPQMRLNGLYSPGGNLLLARGFGWEVEQQPGSEVLFRHGGSNKNFKSFGVGDLRGRAFVVFTNGDDGDKMVPMVVRQATGLDLIAQ